MSRIPELALLGSLLILIGPGAFCVACGNSKCALVGCGQAISISVTNDAGEEVNEATMTANIDDAELTLTCPAATPYTCPNAMLDRNVVSLCCGHEGQGADFLLGNVIGPGYDITVDVTSVDGDHYSGSLQVEITTQEDFNGPGCGTCSNGRAAFEGKVSLCKRLID